ncbi:uncharacterized protein A4U43_C10F4430 [Asparagus officinalis]|uniref:Uncharacterized protein n=1 Tax=Asparagus officinalis TaxID=4686 RepID=A0A5P1E0L6_ASPOF|nr:KS1 protein-like isoform X1 [Asparagus officinalis]ONK56130.1 uncharacterized protein A4U43_C10F4430 [Asparagus officinalis]
MGSSTSKSDQENQLMPTQLLPFREKFEEMKKRRRVRHASIVSTTELLSSNDQDGVDDDSVRRAVEEIVIVVEEKKKEKENMKGRMFRRQDSEEEEMVGSPSFRVYCTAPLAAKDSDDDSIKVIQKIKEEKLAQVKEEKEKLAQEKEEKERVQTHEKENSGNSLISREGSEDKSQKKDMGRMFRALSKAPIRMYSFLSVKTCYCSAENTADGSPHPGHQDRGSSG